MQYLCKHSGDGHQKQYLHGKAGFLLVVADGIGERSMVNCTQGATSPATTGRMEGIGQGWIVQLASILWPWRGIVD